MHTVECAFRIIWILQTVGKADFGIETCIFVTLYMIFNGSNIADNVSLPFYLLYKVSV
jgi:hypothetical protein